MRRLGSIFGFPVYAQTSFLFLLVLWVLPDVRSAEGITSGLIGAAVMSISILLHELGHAIAYRVFGERNATIVLWGLGGLTYGRKPGRPWQDIVISLAGPFFGFVVGMAGFWTVHFFGTQLHPRLNDVLGLVVLINLFWTFVNVLPVHPMDGGQALRTFLVAWKGMTGLKASLVISIVTAALMALAAWKIGQVFMAILAVMMLLRNVGELRGGRDTGMPQAP